jgi:hypothetical protein
LFFSLVGIMSLATVGSWMTPDSALALPRFALRNDLSCSGCHINPTGGGLRNSYGIGSFTRRLLARPSARTETVRYDGQMGHSMRLGADLRFRYLMEQSVTTVDDTTTVDETLTGFNAMAASIYASIQPVRDLTFYLRYDPETDGTEVYGILQNLWGPLYIKAGAFAPEFGLRIDDHTAYVRGGSRGSSRSDGDSLTKGFRFTQDFRDTGVEIGYERSWYRLLAAITNGNGGMDPIGEDKATILRGEIRPSILGTHILAGYSSYSQTDEKTSGFFGGIARGRLAVLVEFDSGDQFNDAAIDTATTEVGAWMLEGTFEVFHGVHLYLRLDNWDPDKSVPGETFTRTVLGLELHPFPYLEIRPQYRMNGEPGTEALPEVRNNKIEVQVHIYL